MRTGLLTVLLLSCGAPDRAIPGRTAQAIVGGSVDGADPAVVAICADGLVVCTGSLVSANAVLTAGHCANVLGESIPVEVVFGPDVTMPTRRVAVMTQRTHPQYTKEGAPFDFAMFELASQVTTVAALRSRNIALTETDVGTTIRHVGFGVSDEATGDGVGTKRDVSYPITRVDSQLVWSGGATAQTCTHDSGGPGFVTREGVEEIAAVVSDGPSCHETGWDGRVDVVADWVASTISEWAPPADAGVTRAPSTAGCQSAPGAPALIAMLARWLRRRQLRSR